MTMDPVSIVGLGKLGASMAAAIAMRGGRVVGVDVSAAAVDAVNAGRAPVQETDLDDTLRAHRDRIRATRDVAEAVHASAITFVIVPTPSDARGAFSFDRAAEAFCGIGRALADKRDYHLVVLTSTVLPGTSRQALLPILEAESGRRPGADFGLCYSPEFIALGSVIRDFLNPDFTLVGELDARSGETLERFYGLLMPDRPPCKRMSLENAELAKISVNSFVTMKIAFANMLAALCERIPGGDVDAVTDAVGTDRRIGARYLRGGLGFGGPCFPRDNVALAFFARALGEPAPLPEATDAANDTVPDRVAAAVAASAPPGGTVALLGLAYKPHSHVTEESQSLAILARLRAQGYRVVAFDPLVRALPAFADDPGVRLAPTLKDSVAAADSVVVATPDPAFCGLVDLVRAGGGRSLTVIDAWRHLPALADVPALVYVPLGRGRDEDRAVDRLRELWGGRPV